LLITKSHYAAILFVVGACACAPADRRPTDPQPVSLPVATAEAPLVTADASAPASAANDLAIGEAIIVEGSPVVENGNPSSDALDYRVTVPGQVVVFGRKAGEGTLRLIGSEPHTFHVVPELCRERSLHPTSSSTSRIVRRSTPGA